MCVVAGSRVVGVGSYPFGVVDHSGKYEDTQSEEDDKEEELVGTGSQCVAQHPQSYKVTRQLKDTQDPNKADHSQETQHVLSCLGGEATETHFQVEGQDGHEVDDVEGVPNEVELIWAESYSHEKFKGEPHHTHALYVGEVGGSLSLLVDVLHCHIVHQLQLGAVDDGVEGLVGLQTEGGDGHQDEEQWDQSYPLSRRRLWMWEAINKDQGRGEDRREERGGGGEERGEKDGEDNEHSSTCK